MLPIMIFTVAMNTSLAECKQDVKAPKKLRLLPALIPLLWDLLLEPLMSLWCKL